MSGSAFPVPAALRVVSIDGQTSRAQSGMTLREYFAIRALQGIMASGDHVDGQGDVERLTSLAVKYADGLITTLSGGADVPRG